MNPVAVLALSDNPAVGEAAVAVRDKLERVRNALASLPHNRVVAGL